MKRSVRLFTAAMVYGIVVLSACTGGSISPSGQSLEESGHPNRSADLPEAQAMVTESSSSPENGVVNSEGTVVAPMNIPGEAPGQEAGGLPDGETVESPQGADHVKWLTYSDSAFGFSIEYPDAYVILDEPKQPESEPSEMLHAVRFQDKSLLGADTAALEPAQFSIEVFTNSDGLPLQEWLQQSGLIPANSQVEEFSIDGRAALRVTRMELIAPGQFVFVENHGQVFLLIPLGSYAEEMLKSFQFTH